MERMRGVARYTDDLKLPGMLHAKILRSPHAHARIKGDRPGPALAMPGVFAAVTGQDFKIPYGIIPWTQDENALAVDKVCHVGDGVAAVAAVDEDTANAACKAIASSTRCCDAFFDPEEALAVRDRENTINPYSRKGNLSKHVAARVRRGRRGAGGVGAGGRGRVLLRGHHARGDRAALRAGPGRGQRDLTVWSATQVSHYLHRELAKVLELPPHRIRVIQPPLGGAFGGKSEPFDLEFCVAKLAMKTGRPVKLLYTREEVFYAHRGRHPMKMKYRTGFTADGKIKAVDAKTIIDGGAYSSFGLVTTYYSGQLLCAPYAFGTYRFDSTRAYTNKPACGPSAGTARCSRASRWRSSSTRRRWRSASTRSSCAGATTSARTPRRSTNFASARTASSSAWRGSRRRRGGRSAAADAAVRARPRGRGLDVHLGHELPDLPQRHAAGGRCRSASTAAGGRGCSAGRTTSARAATRCWR
jgi:4-hydroxybenzoyl-CoA reductase subunit alpha